MGYYDTFSEAQRRKARKLFDIEAEEVSLVRQSGEHENLRHR